MNGLDDLRGKLLESSVENIRLTVCARLDLGEKQDSRSYRRISFGVDVQRLALNALCYTWKPQPHLHADVKRSFPYLVSKEHATGSGNVRISG